MNATSVTTNEEKQHLLKEEEGGRLSDSETTLAGDHSRRKDEEDEDSDSTYGSLDLHSERSSTVPELVAHLEQEGEATAKPAVSPKSQSQKLEDVRWRDLPRKDQLLILVLARLAEPLAQTSMQAYIFYMLKSFDESLSDAAVASQTGFISGSFTLAQCVTAVWWGRMADKEWVGRKNVIVFGLMGTLMATIGIAFSRSLAALMFFRFMGGALNGNVGVMRTMISEIVKDRKYQPKAFLVLPVTFNIGVLIGPVLGGWLQSPVETFPSLFGKDSVFGGADGVYWMRKYPYALPNLVFAGVFVFSISLVIFGLEETHMDRREWPDRPLEIGRSFARFVLKKFRKQSTTDYQVLEASTDAFELETQRHQRNISLISNASTSKRRPKLAYRRIFTPNVCFTFLAACLLHIHVATFNNLWYLFLSTPRAPTTHRHFPLSFTGGLGLPPSTLGFAIGLIGVIGLCLQFGVYSRVVARFGVVNTYRTFCLFTFPCVYLLTPYLALVSTKSISPAPADGVFVWIVISAILFLQVLGRTFTLPLTQILVNNCTPHPSALASVHGLASSLSSGSRTIGPIIFSTLYGFGLKKGRVWIAWWILAVEAVVGASATWLLREGDGHEIWLEGDEE